MAAEAVIFLFLEFAVFKKRNFFTEEVSFFFFRHALQPGRCTFASEVRGENPFNIKFCLYIHFFTYQIFIRFCLLAFIWMIMVRRVIYLIVAAAVIAGCTCREEDGDPNSAPALGQEHLHRAPFTLTKLLGTGIISPILQVRKQA